MAIVQWTWAKAHAGFILNECADMLATNVVKNETPPASVQYLHPINEDKGGEKRDSPNSRMENFRLFQVTGLVILFLHTHIRCRAPALRFLKFRLLSLLLQPPRSRKFSVTEEKQR
jgi:hypothetical protein